MTNGTFTLRHLAVVAAMAFGLAPTSAARKSDYPVLYGNMVSNSTWTGLDYSKTPRGIYALPLKENIEADDITPVVLNPWMNGTYGGAVYGGKYHAFGSCPYENTGYLTQFYIEFDLDEGTLLEQTPCTDALQMAISTTTDPQTGTVYGIFYADAWQQSYELGTIDYNTQVRGDGRFNVSQPFALAADDKGHIYGIGYDDGFLYEFDLNGRAANKIGDTGLGTLKFYQNQWSWSAYPQGLTYDTRSGKLIWAEYRRTDWYDYESNLYEVSLDDGQLTLISQLPDLIEIINLYIPALPADGAPADIENLALNFAKGQLTGNVNFTLPTESYDGSALEEQLSYYIVVDGDTLVSGTGMPGADISADVTVSKAGSTLFKVVAGNDAGLGEAAMLRQWIGYDYPLAVDNLKLALDAATGTMILTWDAVSSTTGTNGGYVDTDQIRYRVTRYPDATVSHYLYTIKDNNTDGCTWANESGNIATETRWTYNALYSQSEADDWLITPAIRLTTDSLYRFDFGVGVGFNSTERIEAGYGTGTADTDTDAYTMLVAPTEFNNPNRNKRFLGANFTVGEAGEYHFGIHAVSDATRGTIVVDSISVRGLCLLGAPAEVTGFKAVAGAEGDLTATITLTAPTLTAMGDALTSLSKIEVYRDDHILVSTIANVEPGQQYTVTDESDDLLNGYHRYFAVAYNDEGNGLENEPVSIWVGIDTPTQPVDVVLSDNFDGTYTVRWAMPSTGIHGGYVDASAFTYTIQKVSATNWVQGLIASNVEGTSYTAELPETQWQQDFFYVAVTATAEGLGTTGRTMSNGIQYGTPNTLPFSESWPNAQYEHPQTWSVNSSVYYSSFLPNAAYSSDDDGGAIRLYGAANAWSQIGTGMIDLGDAVRPELTFSYYAQPGKDDLIEVSVVKANGRDSTKVFTVNFKDLEGEAGWHTETVDLSDYKGQHHIYVSFKGTILEAYTEIVLDCIKIEDAGEATAIAAIGTTGNLSVRSQKGAIVVSSQRAADVAVYTLGGQLVASARAAVGETRIGVARGTYIVACGGRHAKVIVR